MSSPNHFGDRRFGKTLMKGRVDHRTLNLIIKFCVIFELQTNKPTDSLLMIPLGAGEVLDRLTILKLKEAVARTAEQRSTILLEQELLATEWRRCMSNAPETSPEWGELLETNASLWQLEDKVRDFEREGNFGQDFISAARSIYLTNDRRARIKRAVNTRVGSSICDFKFHDAEEGVNP